MLKKERSLLKRDKKAEAAAVPLLETTASSQQSSAVSKIKLAKMIVICVVVLLVILLAVNLIIHFVSGKGKKNAEKLSEYLGSNVGTAEDKLDIHLKDNSSFAIINKSDTFDYILESEDTVKIDDIKFPEWSVTVMKTDSEKIDTVIYTDYKLLKSDSRGEKLDKRPNLDGYSRSTKIGTVIDQIGCEPFRITYSLDFTKYEFRYYYELDNGDMQSVSLTVSADLEGRYFYSASEDLDPFFITSRASSARSAM